METLVYVAGGELVFQHGEALERRTVVHAGDVLYEAPAEQHLVRNEGTADALALLAATEPDPRQVGLVLRRWESVEEPVRRRVEAEVVSRDGIRWRRLVRPGDFGSATFTVTEVEIDPGASQEWHRHPAAEHVLVIFEGRGLVRVGPIEEPLEPLKGIRVEPGLVHRVENTGRTLLRYYVCATPGVDPLVDRERARAPVDRTEGPAEG